MLLCICDWALSRTARGAKKEKDNTAAESSSNSLFTTKTPLCVFTCSQPLLMLTWMSTTIPGYSNELADTISRMDLNKLIASDRIRFFRQHLESFPPSFCFPKGICSLLAADLTRLPVLYPTQKFGRFLGVT